MKHSVVVSDPVSVVSDMLVVFAWSGKQKHPAWSWSAFARSVDKALGGIITETAAIEEFDANYGRLLVLHSHGRIASRRVVVAGVGFLADVTIAELQKVAATIARAAREYSAKNLAICLPHELCRAFGPEKISQAMIEGIMLGSYVFLSHKDEERRKHRPIEELVLVGDNADREAFSLGLVRGTIVGQAVSFARDLVNEPPSLTTPTRLSQVALELAKKDKSITCEVFDRDDMERMGMGGILGIAKGSSEPPKFIKLTYEGKGNGKIALVGKGITFDTGGLSLKSAEHMETMKMDMAGGAAILGIFSVLGQAKPDVSVVGLISATENMPGPSAVKPGDVVRAMNGKTIEILNTDAEGRVVLADALSYAAEKIAPSAIIDLATLTGACMVALGQDIAGLFSNDRELTGRIAAAAKASGEALWELPLAQEYRELIKSQVADIKNITGVRYGGAITAALFLSEFVPKEIAWAHLDIAGPAFAEKDLPLTPYGGTGYGVRLLLEFLR